MTDLSVPTTSSDADRRKANETVYALFSAAYSAEQGTYEWVENKAGRYLTAAAVVFGFATFKADEVLRLLRTPGIDPTHRLWFGLAYGATFLIGIAAMVCALVIMKVGKVPALPLDHTLPNLFAQHGYDAALTAMSTAFQNEADGLRKVNARRAAPLRVLSILVDALLVSVLLTLGLYVRVKVEEPVMPNPDKPPVTSTVPTGGTATPASMPSATPSAQAPPAPVPAFGRVTKKAPATAERRGELHQGAPAARRSDTKK